MAWIRVRWTACLLLLATHCHGKSVIDKRKNEHLLGRTQMMSLDAQQTLFDEMGASGLEKIRDVIPLYREDLASDYIAYWQVEYDTEYITVSSGPQTGDYDILINGNIPSPTSILRDQARSRGRICSRFYVLTSGGEMMCTDNNGKIVATTLPESLIFMNTTRGRVDVDMVEDYIKSKSAEQALMWRVHAKKVRKKQIRDVIDEDEFVMTQRLYSKIFETESKRLNDKHDMINSTYLSTTPSRINERSPTRDDGVFRAQFITAGSSVNIVTGDRSRLREIRIRYIPTDKDDYIRGSYLAQNTKLCQVIKGCSSANQNYALMSLDLIKAGTTYINLELDGDTKRIFKGDDFVFVVDILSKYGSTTSRYFTVEYRPLREKRSSSYSSWSTWSISNEDLFPDYDQFEYNGCAVGCGPVAWGMVFGYYDRRSHLASSFRGSENLYRSGLDGTTGSSSEVAPPYNDERMNNYVGNLNKLLGTYCVIGLGATMHFTMDNVEGFFKARQSSGRPKIEEKQHWLSWLGIYNDGVENWAKEKIQQGWPVIVGWRVDSYLKWHYPVMTKVKVRTRKYKSCVLWWCSTKTSTEGKMYLHMGWGGYRNDWKNLQAYYAVTGLY